MPTSQFLHKILITWTELKPLLKLFKVITKRFYLSNQEILPNNFSSFSYVTKTS